MNDLFDLAWMDIEKLDNNLRIKRKESDENLLHHETAEKKLKTEKGFTAVNFLDYLLENLGTKFFGSIQASDESNTNPEVTENVEQLIIDPCAGCGKSLNGTNWGYLHKGVIHKDFCDTCKTELNKDIGEPCPKCGESIEATFQIA